MNTQINLERKSTCSSQNGMLLLWTSPLLLLNLLYLTAESETESTKQELSVTHSANKPYRMM